MLSCCCVFIYDSLRIRTSTIHAAYKVGNCELCSKQTPIWNARVHHQRSYQQPWSAQAVGILLIEETLLQIYIIAAKAWVNSGSASWLRNCPKISDSSKNKEMVKYCLEWRQISHGIAYKQSKVIQLKTNWATAGLGIVPRASGVRDEWGCWGVRIPNTPTARWLKLTKGWPNECVVAFDLETCVRGMHWGPHE